MAGTRVMQCTNVSPTATLEQLRTLFSYLGKIEDISIFPKEDTVLPVTTRVCFVKYEDESSVGVAQHLTNTVFIDRALIVVPCLEGVIPEEHKALQLAAPGNAVAGMMPQAAGGGGLLPTPELSLLGQIPGLVSTAAGGIDPTYAALGLPQPPPLNNVDPSKIEEIRRTIYVGNLDSAQTVTAEQLLSFFQGIGEVKYVRMAGDETQPTRFAFVEFTDHASVAKALTYNGVMFAGRPLKINHSNNAIVKPPAKTAEAAQRELAETMKQVRDAQALIQAAIDPETKQSLLAAKLETKKDLFQAPAVQPVSKKDPEAAEKKKRSRSRSRSRRRSRSRSRSRRRSRSRSRSRRRSRSRGRRRSYSRYRSRSRTPPPPRRRSRTPPPRRRSPRRRSRTRSPPPPPRRRRSRSRSRDKRSRSKDRRRRSKTPPKSYRASRVSKSKSRSPPPPIRSRRRISRSKSPSHSKSRSRSRSGSPRRSKHKKDKKGRDRERSRERDRSSRKHKKDKERDRKDKDRGSEDKDKDGKKSKSKVKRDYDEEEKGYDSSKEQEGDKDGEGAMKIEVVMGEGNRPVDDTMDANLQAMDMDVDTDE